MDAARRAPRRGGLAQPRCLGHDARSHQHPLHRCGRLAAFSAVAVEPQTHAPQGLRRLLNREPGAMAMIGPAESLRMGVELAFERLADG